MTAVTVRLPKSLHSRARDLAEQDGVSMNQFIMLALAEKVATLDTETFLKERAERGSREKFLQAMAQVPDIEPPDPRDRIE